MSSEVQFYPGYSTYKDNYISDRDLADLVGLDTYKALYSISPELYEDLTHPMTAEKHILCRVNTILSQHESITVESIKANLVIRYVEGESVDTTEIVAGLINSSEKMTIPRMSRSTQLFWIFCLFILVFLIVFVIIFYIWPSLLDFRTHLDVVYGNPKKWISTPWV